jgi:hypothetical protein
MDQAMARYGISVPDRQLACAPFSSPEGRRYFAAMCAAANFGWCNRQAITQRVREVFARVLSGRSGSELRVVYDVAHNTAKVEHFGDITLCVHRKGATRAFGPSEPEVPAGYRSVGQPVFIPGSMGTTSYVLVGSDASRELSLSSACHGAGRAMSRGAAKRQVGLIRSRRQVNYVDNGRDRTRILYSVLFSQFNIGGGRVKRRGIPVGSVLTLSIRNSAVRVPAAVRRATAAKFPCLSSGLHAASFFRDACSCSAGVA